MTGTRTKIKISCFCNYCPVVFPARQVFFEKEMMSNYRKPNTKEALSLRRNFDFIYELADFYLNHLANRELYLCTEIEEIKAGFSKNSLFHLIGIQHVNGNYQLWLDINNRRLKSDNILIQNYTVRKLKVMREFPNLFIGESYLTDGFELQFVTLDKALCTETFILAIGLGKEEEVYFPQTAIDVRGNKKFQSNGQRITDIYYIDYKSGKKIYLKTKEEIDIA